MKVLIVDDSVVFRSQVKAALEGIPGIEIAGVAADGLICLGKLEQVKVDLVTLDLEMPNMNGIDTLKEMRRRGMNQKVIVFAAASTSGASLALESLQAGASDFQAKPKGASLEETQAQIRQELVPKILQFANDFRTPETHHAETAQTRKSVEVSSAPVAPYVRMDLDLLRPQAVGIGCSTGGPVALETIFAKLKGHPIKVPVFVVQHMPPLFTDSLAKRLSYISGHPVKEAKNGETIQPGHVYIAPGDYHMMIGRMGTEASNDFIILNQNPKQNSVRPAVDVTFQSMSERYNKKSFVLVLTGMGEDGMLGAKAIKNERGGVMIQDQESSVVWGMPGAIHAVDAYDEMGSLDACADRLIRMLS